MRPLLPSLSNLCFIAERQVSNLPLREDFIRVLSYRKGNLVLPCKVNFGLFSALTPDLHTHQDKREAPEGPPS